MGKQRGRFLKQKAEGTVLFAEKILYNEHDCTEKTRFLDQYPKNIKLCNYYGRAHGPSPTPLFKGFASSYRGVPVWAPANEIMVDFSIISTKQTFLQCNHEHEFETLVIVRK